MNNPAHYHNQKNCIIQTAKELISYGMKVSNPKVIHGTLSFESPIAIANTMVKGKCFIGAFSYIGRNSEVSNVDIGRYCSIAPRVIIGATNHPIDRFTTHLISFDSFGPFKFSDQFKAIKNNQPNPNNRLRTTIGNDVWIGDGAFIKQGISIGNGAIIAAGSIVVKDVSDYEIVGGNPAKFIRYRFSKKIINDLLVSLWWNKNLESIHSTLNNADDIAEFIEKVSSAPKFLSEKKLYIGKTFELKFEEK